MQERLQKIIARSGLASRRSAEEIVLSGRVRVNGRIVRELGTKADPRRDRIEVDGQRLVAEQFHYVVFHKPRNVVSTLRDPEGRPSVADYVRAVPARIYPVGRLDFATSGVLLMTNDGEFANALLHPKGGVPKTYVLKVQGEMSENDLEPWRKGMQLEDGKTLPADAQLLRLEGGKTWLQVTLREGRNQQIRRMGEASGWRVMRLARVSFAGITSDGLRPGDWRPMSQQELAAFQKEFGVPRRIAGAAKGFEPLEHRRGQGPRKPEAAHAAPAHRTPRPDRPTRGEFKDEGPRGGARRGARSERGSNESDRRVDRAPDRSRRAPTDRPMRGARTDSTPPAREPNRDSRSRSRSPHRDGRPESRPQRDGRPETRSPRGDSRSENRSPHRDSRPERRGPRSEAPRAARGADHKPVRSARSDRSETTPRATERRGSRARGRGGR